MRKRNWEEAYLGGIESTVISEFDRLVNRAVRAQEEEEEEEERRL